MKKLFFFLLSIIFVGSFLTSCNEDVDLIGDFQETAVVFSLLDKSDTLHYVKINRAFIGPGNALDIAQIPDSNYFNQIDATITEFIGGGQTRQWVLQDTLIENKETSGVFYAPFQKVYYFKTTSAAPLNSSGVYKLHISVNGGEFEVDGETELISGISSSADGQSFRFDFAENPGVYLQKGIAANVGNSYLINTTLEVNFREYTSPSAATMKTFKWNLGESDVAPNDTKTFTINGKTFYDLVKSNATVSPSIIQRKMYSIKVIVTGGSEALYNYILVNQPSSTLAQSKPTFTNLSVSANHKAIGIFSSRCTFSIEKLYINPANTSVRMMTSKSVAELCTGPISGNLLFCSQHVGDMSTSYYCP